LRLYFFLKQNPVVKQFQKQEDQKIDNQEPKEKEKKIEYLEVDDSKKVDFKNIVNNNGNKNEQRKKDKVKTKEKENSPDFVDDPDVPPLI
jgi:hypothetical protein